MSSLFLVLLFGLIIWYWYSSLQTNEIATQSARQACKGQRLQFLDGTVVLHGMKISRSDAGQLCLKRTFQFEYSADFDSRKTGFVIMQGSKIETVGLEN